MRRQWKPHSPGIAPAASGCRSGPIKVPTLYLWGDADDTVGRAAAEGTGEFIDAPYRFEVLPGVGHYAADQVPARVNELLLEHLGRYAAWTRLLAALALVLAQTIQQGVELRHHHRGEGRHRIAVGVRVGTVTHRLGGSRFSTVGSMSKNGTPSASTSAFTLAVTSGNG